MVGIGQKQHIVWELRTGHRAVPAGRFEWVPGSRMHRIRCTLCGATGFGSIAPRVWELGERSWQLGCLLPHPIACRCGLSFRSVGHLAQHVKADRYPARAAEHGAVS